MAPSTPTNLVENSNNLPLAMRNEHWTLSANEDKRLCLINSCKSILSNTTMGCKPSASDWFHIMCTSVKTRDNISSAYRASWCPPSSHSVFIVWSTSSNGSWVFSWVSYCEIHNPSSTYSLSSSNASGVLHNSKMLYNFLSSFSKKLSVTDASNITLNHHLFVPKYVS